MIYYSRYFSKFLFFVGLILVIFSCKKEENLDPATNSGNYNNTIEEWRLMDMSSGLSGNYITAIGEDKTNKVWVSTYTDYSIQTSPTSWSYYQTSTLQHLKKEGLIVAKLDSTDSEHLKGRVSGMCFDANNEMHLTMHYMDVGTNDAIVSRENGIYSRIDKPSGSGSGNFSDIIKNGDGLWIGATYDGLFNLSNGVFTKYDNTNSAIPNGPQRFGLVKMNNSEFFINARQRVLFHSGSGISDYFMENVWADGMDVDANGHVVTVGLSNTSINCEIRRSDGVNTTIITTPIDYDLGTISSLVVDSHDNIWIAKTGSNSPGLYKYNGTDWQQYTMANSPLHSYGITKLFVDSEGNLWIGSSDAGVLVLNEFGTRN